MLKKNFITITVRYGHDHDHDHDHGHAIHEVSRYGTKWHGTVRKIHVHAPTFTVIDIFVK